MLNHSILCLGCKIMWYHVYFYRKFYQVKESHNKKHSTGIQDNGFLWSKLSLGAARPKRDRSWSALLVLSPQTSIAAVLQEGQHTPVMPAGAMFVNGIREHTGPHVQLLWPVFSLWSSPTWGHVVIQVCPCSFALSHGDNRGWHCHLAP